MIPSRRGRTAIYLVVVFGSLIPGALIGESIIEALFPGYSVYGVLLGLVLAPSLVITLRVFGAIFLDLDPTLADDRRPPIALRSELIDRVVRLHDAPMPVPPIRVHGRVVLERAVVAPLSGERCAAFRLVGKAGPFEIDDSGVGHFEVRREGGDAVVVETEDAFVALISDPAVAVEMSPALDRYLADRGVPSSARLQLREERLDDGDEVTVEGEPMDRERAEGYRGAERVLVFLDRPGAPLLIRRCTPGSSTGAFLPGRDGDLEPDQTAEQPHRMDTQAAKRSGPVPGVAGSWR